MENSTRRSMLLATLAAPFLLAEDHGHASKPSALGAPTKAHEKKPGAAVHAPAEHAKAADAHAPAQGHGGGHDAVVAADPDEVLAELMAGNKRFVAGRPLRPHTNLARLKETAANGQHPSTVCLSCADSRVPVEMIFDQGVGDIFTVRVAGNVSNTDEIGSLEYAVEHFGSPLCVVLGHLECGAVKAVVNGDKVSSSIASMVKHIGEAVDKTRKYNPALASKELVTQAVRVNVWESIEDLLKGSEIIAAKARTGQVRIVGAVYHIDSGRVEWLGTYPGALSVLR